MKNYYDILKIKSTANAEEIKTAYRNLAKKYHPDINKAIGAKEILVDVNEAYDTLGDEKKRVEYDKKLAAHIVKSGYPKTGAYPKTGQQPPPYPKTGPYAKGAHPPPYPKTGPYGKPPPSHPPPPPPYGQPNHNSRPQPHQRSFGSDAALQKHLREMETKRAFSDGFSKGTGEAQERANIAINQLKQENKILSERISELTKRNAEYFKEIEVLNLDIKKERADLEEQIQQIEKMAEEEASHGGKCVKNCPNEVEVENLKIEYTILTARVDRYKDSIKQLEEDKQKKEQEIVELNAQLDALNTHIDELDDYIDALTGDSEEEYEEGNEE